MLDTHQYWRPQLVSGDQATRYSVLLAVPFEPLALVK